MSTAAKNTGLTELLPQFIKDLNRLQPEYSYADRIWQLHLRTGDKPKDWVMLRVTHYQETYYLFWTLCDLTLELDSRGHARTPAVENLAGKEQRKLVYALKYLNRQVRRIKQDWVRFYRQTECHSRLCDRRGSASGSEPKSAHSMHVCPDRKLTPTGSHPDSTSARSQPCATISSSTTELQCLR
jgi:hypothetical protein